MSKIDFDAYEEENLIPGATKRIERKNRRLSQREKRVRFVAELAEHADKVPDEVIQDFTPTFQPAEHERFWLISYLEEYYNNKVISDILWKVKGGKEDVPCKKPPQEHGP